MVNNDIVAEIFENAARAALDHDAWRDVDAGMLRAFSSSFFGIFSHDIQTKHASVHVVDPDYATYMQDYIHDYADKSLLLDDMIRRPSGALYSDQYFPNYDDYLKSAVYNELFHKMGADHSLMFVSDKVGANVEYFGVRRDRKAGHFERHDFELMQRLSGVIANTRLINRKLAQAQITTTALESVLERLPSGVLLLDAKGRSIYANSAAENILAAGDGLLRRLDGSLAVVRTREAAALAHLIRRTVDTTAGLMARVGGLARITRNNDRPPYGLLVTALPDDQVEDRRFPGIRKPVALVLITDPARKYIDADRQIADILGLSPQEARVVSVLMGGETVRDAAQKLGITEETARGYVKQALTKTGTGRQSALVSLAFRTFPFVRD